MMMAINQSMKSNSRYQSYLLSDHWKALRGLKLNQQRFRCQCCRETKRLQVHHRHYRDLVSCTLNDLMVLCESCHQILHALLENMGEKPGSLTEQETINLARSVRFPRSMQPKQLAAKSKIIALGSSRKERQSERLDQLPVIPFNLRREIETYAHLECPLVSGQEIKELIHKKLHVWSRGSWSKQSNWKGYLSQLNTKKYKIAKKARR